jgi:hypothetical protein
VLDTVNIVISNAANRQEYVALAFDGVNFLACWQDRRSGGGNYNIYFTRIDTAGIVLNPTGTALCAEAQNQQYPDVVFSGSHYMIVWEDYRGGVNWDIFGSRVDTAGNILDPSGLAITTAGNNQRYPAVAFGNNTYLVGWSDNRNATDYDLYACRVDTNGLVLDIDGVAVTNAVENQTNPEIIYDGTNFLLVWEDFRADTESDIYGAKISTAGALVTLMPITLQANDQVSPQLCRGVANEVILSYSGWVGTFNKIPYNTQRIWAKYYDVNAGWAQLAVMPTQIPGKLVKDGGSMVVVDQDKDGSAIYAFRGYKSNEFYKYSGKEWTRMESMPFGTKLPPDTMTANKKRVGKGGALCYDGYNTIYATKGNSTYEFWAYDIIDNTWIHKKFLSTAKGLKGGTSICYANGKVYLLAGGQASYVDNFYCYDPSTNTWNGLAKAPVEPYFKAWKDGSCIVPVGNTIYALKGGDKYNSFWAYDIATNTWTQKESLPQVHPMITKKTRTKDGGAITTDGTNIYIIKGGGKQDFWKYTPDTIGAWTAMDTIPLGARGKKGVPKTGAGLGYYNYVIYLLKGNKTDELWQYALTTTDKVIQPNTGQTVSANTGLVSQINLQVLPNPMAKFGEINYTVPLSGKVSIKLYNTSGRLVETIKDGYANAGSYTLNLSSENLAKGIYFLRYNDKTNKREIKVIIE